MMNALEPISSWFAANPISGSILLSIVGNFLSPKHTIYTIINAIRPGSTFFESLKLKNHNAQKEIVFKIYQNPLNAFALFVRKILFNALLAAVAVLASQLLHHNLWLYFICTCVFYYNLFQICLDALMQIIYIKIAKHFPLDDS